MNQMTASRKLALKTLLAFITSIPGPSVYLAYSLLKDKALVSRLELFHEKKDLSNMIAGFSFTMLGFLAAVITILFAFVHTEAFQKYMRKGYLEVLFSFYFFIIISLTLTAFLSIYGYSAQNYIWPFRLMLMSFVNNLIQVSILAVMISNLAKNASMSKP